MSRLIFDADTLGGTTTLSSADAVGNFTLIVPAVDGTLSVKDSSGDATFRNLTLTGAVLAGAWNGTRIGVAYGGTGATTLTGYVKGNGTAAMTASSTIPNTDITGLGTMSTQNANAVTITGGTIAGLSAAIPVGSGGTGVATLTGYVKGNGTSIMTASATIPNTDITGLGTMSTQGSDAVTITGGTANGLTIGGTTAAAGTFTTLRFNSTLSANGNTGTAGQVLTSNGASAPTWNSIAGVGTVTSVDGSGGTTGLTLTGGPITASGTLTLGGTLAAVNGGTGQSSYVIGNLLYASTTTALTKLAIGTTGQVLTVAGGVPSWATPTTGTVTSVAGTGTVNGLTLTGTVTSSGSLTLGGTLDLSSPPTIGGTTAAAASFTTLNSSGATRLGGASGNQSLQVNNVASAVNYAQIVGAVTGAAPTLSAQGTDTNIGLVLNGKGTGVVALGGSTVANSAAQFVPTASGANYLTFTGTASGSFSTTIGSDGTDSVVNINFRPKSSGSNVFYSSGTIQTIISGAAAVNYLQLTGAATGANPTLSAQGSDTNISLTLTPKGTGVVSTTSLTLSSTLTTAAYTETITASGTVGASATLAITAGTILTATLTSATACTFTMPTATAGKSFTLLLKQPASGTATTATFTGVKWGTAGAPTITATLGKLDILAFVADGTNWYGTAAQGYTY